MIQTRETRIGFRTVEFFPQDGVYLNGTKLVVKGINRHSDEHFLDMCDSLGIVYMDELAGWQNCYDEKVGSKLVKEMVQRDVNHPSIIIWSNGNEGGWNYQLDKLFAQYDKLQKRHVVHPWADFNDLDTHHYPAYLTGVARFTNGYKVCLQNSCMPCTTREEVPDYGTSGIAGVRTPCLPEDLSGYSAMKLPNGVTKEVFWILTSQMHLME